MWSLFQSLIVFAVVGSNIHWQWTEERGSEETETKMRKTLFTILCSALIAASSIQVAAAAEHHNARKTSPKQATVNEQFRNSNNEQFRNSNVNAVCGIFPGPCQ
jgi:hypothetical protein